MEFNFDGPRGPQSDSDSLSSDRLQKAIERNRAKQARRTNRTSAPPNKPGVDLSGASSRTSSGRSGFKLPGRGRTASKASASSSAPNATRRSVARPGEQEFATSVRRNVQKPPADVSYVNSTPNPRSRRASTASARSNAVPTTRRPAAITTRRATTTRRKVKRQPDKKTRVFIMGCWVLLGVMCLRLIFSRGGVIDYYANKGLLEGKVEEHSSVIVENKELIFEIRKIKKNKSYQKKLVRDHLGFIAKDEYLILFPKEKS
ncbi:MAG: hypothetical protein KC493_09500 [Bacteriovoracaceae bacterium]|nr:hypothetical protein [Bacteriovoracaceae bacterium]